MRARKARKKGGLRLSFPLLSLMLLSKLIIMIAFFPIDQLTNFESMHNRDQHYTIDHNRLYTIYTRHVSQTKGTHSQADKCKSYSVGSLEDWGDIVGTLLLFVIPTLQSCIPDWEGADDFEN